MSKAGPGSGGPQKSCLSDREKGLLFEVLRVLDPCIPGHDLIDQANVLQIKGLETLLHVLASLDL